MSWLFSQALVEEYSAGTCLAGQPFAQLNVMPTPHKFWRSDKTIEPCDHSRFGLTSQLLTDVHGAELLTSFLAASLARTSAQRALEPESKEAEAACGAIWRGSLARYDHDSFMWKTAQSSLLGDSEKFLETWPRWGSMLNGELFLRPTPALRTRGKESGFWQTPVADDAIECKAGKWNSLGRTEVVGRGEAVDDSECIRRAARREDNRQHDGHQPSATDQIACILADAYGDEFHRRGGVVQMGRRGRAEEDGHSGYTCRNEWPAEPAVGRVVDGMAHRVDMLKAIGNGQVPRVAAAAWEILSK